MKRMLSVMLLSALLVSMVSCGESGQTVTDTSNVSDSSATDTQTDIYDALPQKDFGDTEINILSYASSYGARDEFLYSEQTGEVVDDALFQRNLDTEQRLGVKLVYDDTHTEYDAITAFTNSVLAGDASYDTFAFKIYALGSIFTSGVLRTWDDIAGYNLENPWYIHDANDTYTVGGKKIVLFSDALATNMTCAWAFAYNKRLAEEWKIGDVNQIVRDGNWTMETLQKLTKDVFVDVNGDNTPDENDIYGLYLDVGGPLDPFMMSHGVYSLSKDKDDYPTVTLYSEKLVESFERCYSLLWESTGTYVHAYGGEYKYYDYVKNFANGQALFSPMFIQYLMEDNMRAMTDEYGVLPYPKLNAEQEEYSTYTLARHGAFYLPKTLTSDKAEKIGYVVECLSAYSYKYLRSAIYDVSLTTKGVRDEESVEMLDLVLASRHYDFVSALQYKGSFKFTQDKTYRNLLAAKNKDIASFYEANKESANQYIEDLVKILEDTE